VTAQAVGAESRFLNSSMRLSRSPRLVADASLTRPAAGSVPAAGETALRHSGTAIASVEFLLPRFGAAPKDGVGRDADGVLDSEQLAKLIEAGK